MYGNLGGNDALGGYASDDASHGSDDSDVECVDTDDGTSADQLGVLGGVQGLGTRQAQWGTPQAAAPFKPWDRQAYNTVYQGLSKPSWVVYPKENMRLLLALRQQWLGGGDLSAHRTEEENFVQELLPDTLSKCMEETNSWGPSIHADIMECCSALMAALAARLGVLGAGLEADEGDLVPLLQSATAAVDATCMFHKQHKLDRLPDRLDALHAEDWAASRDEGEELVEASPGGPFVQCLVPRYQWLTYLINIAGSTGALEAIMTAVETTDALTLRTLEAAMKFLSKVGPWLRPAHRARCQAAAGCALQFAERCIADPEAGATLAGRPREPRERSLGWVSALVRTVHSTLSGLSSPATATGMVLGAQCALAQAMLAAGTFNLQLAGVREINSLLDAVHPPAVAGPSAQPHGLGAAAVTPVGAAAASTALLTLRQPGGGGAPDNDALPGGFIPASSSLALLRAGGDGLDADLHSIFGGSTPPPGDLPSPVTPAPVETAEFARLAAYAVGWVNTTGVVATALRGALHLKQYVEQVERIMRVLLRAGALPDDHLALVWDMSQRADTFEETKANLFGMLASLAGEFSPGQLDALFGWFEETPSHGTSAADQGRTLGLVLALARGDATGAMAGRLTRLLWHKLMEEPQQRGGVARQDSQMDVRMDTGGGPSTAAAAAPLADDGTAGGGAPTKAVLDTLVEVCGHYSSSPVGQAALEELLVMCVEALRQRCGVGTSPVVVLLRCLLEQQQKPRDGDAAGGSDGGERVRALDARYGLHALLLDDVCSYADAHPVGLDGITRRLRLLLTLLQWADTCLDAGPAERLWAATVAGPASRGGNTACAAWFSDACKGAILSAAEPAAARGNPRRAAVLTQDACRSVLTLVGAIPARDQTVATFACAGSVIVTLALASGAMAVVSHVERAGWDQAPSGAMAAASQRNASVATMRVLSLQFDGLAYMWDVVTRGSEGIAPQASIWLADIFQMLDGPSPADTSRLRKSFLEQATQRLQQAASDVLVGASAGQQHGAAQRARRTIHLLLQLLHRDASQNVGGTQPQPQPHVATYRGRAVELELTSFQGAQVPQHLSPTACVRVTSAAGAQPKVVMDVWAHEYYSSLRSKVATFLGVPPDRVRLISMGTILGDTTNSVHHMCAHLRGSPVMVALKMPTTTEAGFPTPVPLPSPGMDVDAAISPAVVTSPPLPGTPAVALPEGAQESQQPATQPLQPPSPPGSPQPAGPPSQAVPDMASVRQLVAAVPGVYDTLLSLADCPPAGTATSLHGTLCDAALELLGLLPTQVELLSQVKAILMGAAADATAAQSRLRALLATPVSRRAYILQILDGLVYPVNADGGEQLSGAGTTEALQALRATQHILDALHPRNVSSCGGTSALRALFLTGLNVLDTSREADEEAVEDSAMGDVDPTLDMLAWLLPRVARGFAPSDPGGVLSAPGDEKGDVSMDSAAVTSAAGASDTDGEPMAVSSGGAHGGPSFATHTDAGGKRSTSLLGEEEEMPPDDMYMTMKALDLLHSVVEHHAAGLLPLLSRADAQAVVANILLLCPHDEVRARFAEVCSELALPRETGGGAAAVSPPGGAAGGMSDHAPSRRLLLGLLLGLRAVADSDACAFTCCQYFDLTAALLSRHSHEAAAAGAQAGAGASLEAVLAQEVMALLTCAPCTNAEDYRLCGHLQLVLALVRGISRRGLLTPSGVPLLTVLLKRFLFPEAAILESLILEEEDDDAPRAGAGGRQPVVHDIEAEALTLTAIASTPDSRYHCLELVVALATRDVGALKTVGDVLTVLHMFMAKGVHNSIQAWTFERMPGSLPRPDRGYVGLGNGGATCYMNSVFQQLFMQPDIRRGVLEASDAGEGDPNDSVLCQLQTIFGALLAYKQDHYRPENFWKAFKDYDGQPVNVREHQDALEFLLRLQDQVDAAVKRGSQAQQPPALEGGEGEGVPQGPPGGVGAIERVLGGVLVSQIVCRTCPAHRSERDEVINSLAVDIRNKSGLLESLAAYVQGELLEGDNRWECEQCGCKVDAVKRQVIKELPHTLCFQLKRFEFDYETMQRLKVKDRFEFPQELDMRPFTVDVDPSGAGGSAGDAKPEWYYKYTLMGVVVHSGSAFAGHYYSYIRERVEPAPGSGQQHVTPGPWYVFDDRRVEPYDAVNLERDTFGGKYATEAWDAMRGSFVTNAEHDRPNSAYMLFFERLGEPQGPAAAATAAAAAAASGGEPPAAPPVRLPARVATEVRSANAECVFESHVLSKEYFTFVRQLVEANAEAAASRKRRRPAAAAAAAALTSGQGSGAGGSDAGTPRSDEILVDLSGTFLMHVFSRAGVSLRDDGAAWTALVSSLVEGSPTACRTLLKWLAAQERCVALFTLMARCPLESTRELWRAICSATLVAGVSHEDEAGDYTTLMEVLSTYDIGPADSSGRSGDGSMSPERPEGEVSPTLPTLTDLRPDDEAWAQTGPVLLNSAVMRLVGFLPRGSRIKSKADLHMANVVLTLKAYAEVGPVQRAHLVALRTIHYMLDYMDEKLFLSDYAQRPDGGARQAAMSGMYALMSTLVRGAGGPHPSAGPSRRGGHSRGGQPNPYALSTDGQDDEAVPPMVEETRGVLFTRHTRYSTRFLVSLIENAPFNQDARELVLYLCWEDYRTSLYFLQQLVKRLSEVAVHPDAMPHHLAPYLRCLTAMVTLEDSEECQGQRAAMLLIGLVPPGRYQTVAGLLGLLSTYTVDSPCRASLLRWLLELMQGDWTIGGWVKHYLTGDMADHWEMAVQTIWDQAHQAGTQGLSPTSQAEFSNLMGTLEEVRVHLAAI